MNVSTQTNEDNIDSVEQKFILMKGLRDLKSESGMVDVTLIVDGIKMEPCHKLVLAASSPYFRAMFTSGMAEQNKSEINISGVSPDAMKEIINYIYCGDILITDNNVQSLTTASSLLQVIGVYGMCRDYIIGHMDLQNCVEIYKFSRAICCRIIENEAFKYIVHKFSDVITTPAFLTLDKDEMVNIISSDKLWVTKEETVFEAVLSWLKSDVSAHGKHAVEVLSYVRYVLIDQTYLEECIVQSEIVDIFPHFKTQVNAAMEFIKQKKREENQEIEAETKTKKSYSVNIKDPEGQEFTVKLPLISHPRAGMCCEHLLLFTNGRKTFLFDPVKWKYYGDTQMGNLTDNTRRKELFNGFCGEMPILKNPEAYATTTGDVYLLGGLECDKVLLGAMKRKVYLFCSETRKWKVCASHPLPRCMTSYGDANDEFYILGGKSMSGNSVLSRVHKYNRLQNTWVDCAPLPEQLYGHASASYADKIYVIGGKTSTGDIMSSFFVYSSENDEWTGLTNMQLPRYLHGCAVNKDLGLIHVTGGSNADGVLDAHEIYNLSTESWISGEPFPDTRCAQTLLFVGEKLMSVGGYITTTTEDGRYESTEINDIHAFNDTNKWERLTRHIRGTLTTPCACVSVFINPQTFY